MSIWNQALHDVYEAVDAVGVSDTRVGVSSTHPDVPITRLCVFDTRPGVSNTHVDVSNTRVCVSRRCTTRTKQWASRTRPPRTSGRQVCSATQTPRTSSRAAGGAPPAPVIEVGFDRTVLHWTEILEDDSTHPHADLQTSQ